MSKYYQKVLNPLTYYLEVSLEGESEGALPPNPLTPPHPELVGSEKRKSLG